MKCRAGSLKETLLSIIEEMGGHPEKYARNPGRDFTRRRAALLLNPHYTLRTRTPAGPAQSGSMAGTCTISTHCLT